MTTARARSAADIPDKVYFRIGESARLVGVEPHVLRYWEGEFPRLRPKRLRSGQRLYRRRDLLLLLRIRELLYDEGYTIAGARRVLERSGSERGEQRERSGAEAMLVRVRGELQEILRILNTERE